MTRYAWSGPSAACLLSTRDTRFPLNTGDSIFAIGFGTFQDPDAQEEGVSKALKMGMRLKIDTAREYNVEKQEIFLGTKLWYNDYHPDDVERALDESLADLDTPYVDLFMMHYPCTFRRGNERFPRDAQGKMLLGDTTYVDTWKAMEQLLKTRKVKNLGVSNFSKGELETLLRECSVMEVHPYPQQKTFDQWLKSNGIHVVQFSPLGNMNDLYRKTGWSKEEEIGGKYGKSPVQVALAWGVNNGRSVIPKSIINWQVKENVEADFEMEEEDMKKMETLDIKARFNDPSLDYQWRLYSDLEGIEGAMQGKTH
ncbi:NADP-dependent oxidoreductase domain-containing protein [Hypoxylon sp. FL1150]|nr:NADP-dependent oxidoreductase domain-containing protein [Hypoxylon sp. FL1150]